MKLLEIKNNLVKLSFEVGENIVLGRFMVLVAEGRSYVAQFVNLTAENGQNTAIARLLFTFTADGIVDDYDGSIPSMDSELSLLSSDELLDLLPSETPIKIGTLAQEDTVFNIDISAFEHNFTVFVKRDKDKFNFISNSVRQLFQSKEKTVIIDTDNLFEDYPKIVFSKDFKLPLNSDMIDYLFEYELADVDVNTKAVLQDIFYNVQEYIKTLEYEFLPVDKFIDVVAMQYKETQMPELALLKNKLLSYRDNNVFANSKEEFLDFVDTIHERNCSIIDLKDVNEALQNYIFGFIHAELEKFDKFVYLFVPLNDYNSTKKLLKRFINHNHVFTTMLINSDYKYSKELKSHAENIIIFAPNEENHDFANYSTFLDKLNSGECVVYGALTHNIPFIVSVFDIDLPLTKEDVLGDRYRFVPVQENLQLVKTGTNVPFSLPVQEAEEENIVEDTSLQEFTEVTENDSIEVENSVEMEDLEEPLPMETVLEELKPEEEPEIENILEEDTEPEHIQYEDEASVEDTIEEDVREDLNIQDFEDSLEEVEEDYNELQEDEIGENVFEQDIELTEDDLDYIEESNLTANSEEEIVEQEDFEDVVEEQPHVVPVYPAEEEQGNADGLAFNQGDTVTHPRYGQGVIEKIIKYGNKTLCSISFDNVGRRLLDPSISEFEKVE